MNWYALYELVRTIINSYELHQILDASNIYGSDERFSRSLRDFSRDRGLLRTGLLRTQDGGKTLLPFNVNAPMDCQVYYNWMKNKFDKALLGLYKRYNIWFPVFIGNFSAFRGL